MVHDFRKRTANYRQHYQAPLPSYSVHSTNLMAPLVRLPSLHVFSFEIPNQNQAAVFGDSGVWTSHGKYSGMSLLHCEKSIALYFSVSNSIARICTYKYSASSSAENTTKITRSNYTRHTHPISSEGVPASEWGVAIAAQNENKTCLFRLLRLQEFPNFPKCDLSRAFDGVAVDPRRNGGESLDTDEQ
jgi:hypothetical protein